jgi:outer membrane protein assembly factor BamA
MSMGGHSDLRGYSSDRKATSKLLGSLQWRKLLFGPNEYTIPWVGPFDISVNLTFFMDTGALTDSFDKLTLSDFNSTAGGGIEIVSPLQNLIRLEYAGDAHGSGGFYFISGSRF